MDKKDLETIFARGGAPWSVKYYKEKILTALTADLAQRETEGIDESVCRKVYDALNEAVSLVEDIKDGGIFFKHFYEKLEEFKEIYYNWNGVKNKNGRKRLHKDLRLRKKTMFSDFYRKIKKLKKTNNDERLMQYEILFGTEAERMDRLNNTFMRLVKDHEDDLFIELSQTLNVFNKVRAKWNEKKDEQFEK